MAAQKYIDPREAREHFSYGNYPKALQTFQKLLKQEPDNKEYNLAVALCYLNLNMDKTQATPYLEKLSKQEKVDNEVWFYLGQAYQYGNKFDEAIKAYKKYKILAKPKEIEVADRAIETCENGKQLVKYPLDVTYENLGAIVNSPYPEYYPHVTPDESFLVFTSRRRGVIGNRIEYDGFYSSDVFYSMVVMGQWTKVKNAGSLVNTAFDEQAVGISPDGKQMIVYIDHIEEMGELYVSNKSKRSFMRREKLNAAVNAGFESSGYIAQEHDIIFFASERAGGLGGTDLYMIKKLPNGDWALPQSLGANINTPYGEDFPQLGADGKTLFFSSEGHTSMGSYDVFRVEGDIETNTWGTPKNLGYPLNTTYDDRIVSFTQDYRVAYLSAVRPEGSGDLDLYRVKFNDVDARYAVVTGNVITGDSLNPRVNATITSMNMKTGEELTFKPIPKDGRFVMALEPGTYTVTVEAKGFEFLTDKVEIYDKAFQPAIKKDFTLTPTGN